MPISPGRLIFVCITAVFYSSMAYAVKEDSPLHWSSQRTIWDRKANRVELFGNAVIQQRGETLTADYAALNLVDRTVDAKGNCIYNASQLKIEGREMHFNLDTRTGTVIGGRVTGDQFSLTGEVINKLGDSRFQTHNGSYTTCRDCPQSWSIRAQDVDLEFEGYAYMNGVTTRVKESPVFWMPYLVIPLKTKRQTGFLFPRLGFSSSEFNYLQPFFWAINEHADMTLGVGDYGGRGFRGEWEGRYQLTTRSGGTGKFFYQSDENFKKGQIKDGRADLAVGKRWAFEVKELQELHFGIEQKLKLMDASDNLYTSEFKDIDSNGNPALTSTLIFSHNSDSMSSYIAANKFRNLLTADPLKFDTNTVQVYPTASIATNEKFLFDTGVSGGINLGATHFTRAGPTFDRDEFTDPTLVTGPARLGQDPIRKATRISYTPAMYTAFQPLGVFSLVPRVEYRGFYYNFENALPDLNRGYVLGRVDLFTQLERVYDTPDPDIPRMKHLIRPMLSYSVIPYVQEDYLGKNQGISHPFLQQIEYSKTNKFTGYSFDSYDVVPRDESRSYSQYFEPQGNSLSYGFTTQLIRRRGAVEMERPGYQRVVEWKSGQSYNFRELKRKEGDRQPFSKAYSSLGFSFDPWSGGINHNYYPYFPIDEEHSRNTFSGSFNYTFEKGTHQNFLVFERSLGLNYSWAKTDLQTSNIRANAVYSLSDYVMPNFSVNYDFLKSRGRRWLGLGTGLKFQSPSQCWQLTLATERVPCEIKNRPGFCVNSTFDLSLNLAGNGFSGVSEVATKAGIAPAQTQ